MNVTRWPEVWRRRRGGLGISSLFAAFYACFFRWLFLEGKFGVGSDSFYYSFPLRTIAWAMIRHGSPPLWTPLLMSGYPLLAMTQIGIGYPLTWGYLFLPNYWAEQLYISAPHLLAPIFIYAYAREIKLSRLASILAALSFTYSGIMIGVLSLYGYMSNGVMWLPLMLIAIERARRPRRFTACAVGAGAAYAMSVLNGYPQGFLFVGMLAGGYGLFNSLTYPAGDARAWFTLKRANVLSWERWKPLAVALAASALGTGVAAFQLLETLRAARRSVRVALTTDLYYGGSESLTPYELTSLVAPLYAWAISAYVPPLALILAAFACAVAVVHRHRRSRASGGDPRVLYWTLAAVAGYVLMLGVKTPVYRLLLTLPILKSLQVPMRFSFVWTFAISMLAAYGWDALRLKREARDEHQTPAGRSFTQRRAVGVAFACLALALWVGSLWSARVHGAPLASTDPLIVGFHHSPYILWKLLFTALMLCALWQGLKITATRTRLVSLLCVILLSCFVEAQISVSYWWHGYAKPAARYAAAADATRFLQQFAPEENRVYTRVGLFSEERAAHPALDPPNVTAIYGLHNVAGGEPLILERYSRALGNVLSDTVSPRSGSPSNLSLLDSRSHVLSMLNTTHLVSYSGLAATREAVVRKDEIAFGSALDLELRPGETTTVGAMNGAGDTLVIVSLLANSAGAEQGAVCARLRARTVDGRIIERLIRAGVDTSEWAHERGDVRPTIRHALAPVFDSNLAGNADGSASYRYWTRLPLSERVQLASIEISNVSATATFMLPLGTLYDSASRASTPLVPFVNSPWRQVYNQDDVVILRNTRVLPRAWLVAEAKSTDGEEALRLIRGEGEGAFDPRRTALLETAPDELPPLLPGGTLPDGATAARLSYQPNGMDIETDAAAAALLVVSEMVYPGWEATVDGNLTPIHTTNFIMRGVFVPPGHHHVEMRYVAPAARNGALISLFTLLLMCGLVVHSRRRIASL